MTPDDEVRSVMLMLDCDRETAETLLIWAEYQAAAHEAKEAT